MTPRDAGGSGKCVRLLLVEDYEPWRRSIRSMLQNVSGVQVIGEVPDGLTAVRQSRVLQPDLILLDIGLPMLNGIEAARRIRQVSPASKILFVSENRSGAIAEEALRAGGSGYVVKSAAAMELLPAVEAVLQGKPFLSDGLMDLDPIRPKVESAASPARREEVAVSSRSQSIEITSHELRFYPDDTRLTGGFVLWIEGALKEGKKVAVVVATELQRAAILEKLNSDVVDVEDAIEWKRYIQLYVAGAQSTFTPDSSTGGNGFERFVPYGTGELMRTAKERNLRAAVG